MPRTGARLRPGSVFAGDFRVLGVLDEGGMGEVYRVEQLSTQCERALKVLKPRLRRDARSVERFVQEAVVGSRVPSEHVVKVLSAGIDDEDGIPWIAMELLEGETLRALLEREGPMDAARALGVLRPLCHALAAAHGVGVVHRDLKPDNVFVTPQRSALGGHTVKLLDFGLAKVLEEWESARQSTVVLGSPLWMAPEQVRREKITPATDVWALGLLAFWLLTGRSYWRAANGEGASSFEAIVHEKLYGPLEPASRRARALGATTALPHGFDDWFRRCVHRAPSERFADADRAAEVLVRVLVRAELGLAPASRRSWYVAGALVLTVAGGLAWRERPARSAAVRTTGSAVAARLPPARTTGPSVTAMEPPVTVTDAAVSVRDAAVLVRIPPPALRAARVADAGHAGRTTPMAAGFTFRAREGNNYGCPRDRPAAFELTPDWYLTEQERFATRARNAASEDAMAGRANDPDDRARMLAHAAESRAQLARDRALFLDRVDRTLAESRTQWLIAASANHCVERGLHVSATAAYAVWCCP